MAKNGRTRTALSIRVAAVSKGVVGKTGPLQPRLCPTNCRPRLLYQMELGLVISRKVCNNGKGVFDAAGEVIYTQTK
jgi:hypothetical protein